MGPKTEKLIEVLDQLIKILDEDGQSHWSKWMRQAKGCIQSSYFSGIEKVLNAYGGMGSFNDVCLKKVTRANENFSELQGKAWSLATEIKREYESNT
ncbi:DUF6966 domain-containing protein [Glaciecola sp. 1036]|uniref:DUF6966 domain-containing protein n=1 Tax=Alteromonadaceae TaxID=72275 RepID=UPI003D06DD04